MTNKKTKLIRCGISAMGQKKVRLTMVVPIRLGTCGFPGP